MEYDVLSDNIYEDGGNDNTLKLQKENKVQQQGLVNKTSTASNLFDTDPSDYDDSVEGNTEDTTEFSKEKEQLFEENDRMQDQSQENMDNIVFQPASQVQNLFLSDSSNEEDSDESLTGNFKASKAKISRRSSNKNDSDSNSQKSDNDLEKKEKFRKNCKRQSKRDGATKKVAAKMSKKASKTIDNAEKLAAMRRRGEISLETQALLHSIYETDNYEAIKDSKKALLERIRSRKSSKLPATKQRFESKDLKIPVIRAKEPPIKSGRMMMIRQLKSHALKQGAEEMAKLFGYSSYQEQRSNLDKLEKLKASIRETKVVQEVSQTSNEPKPDERSSLKEFQPEKNNIQVDCVESKSEQDGTHANHKESKPETLSSSDIAHKPSKITLHYKNDDKEYETISEDTEENSTKEDSIAMDQLSDTSNEKKNEVQDNERKPSNKEKAAAFRSILEAEEKNKRRKKQGNNFVELEAEEEEEENALQIGGLGDFGFGVPKTKNTVDKEDDIPGLNEDDLEGIVDDVSDDEKDKDAVDFFHATDVQRDDLELKEVMRNVREGFGRNQRAFSGLENARGRFGIDELVAADGSKKEAARLGLLESDEELSDDENKSDAEEEDEETKMERMLRQRFTLQHDVYITSSEDESEVEEDTNMGMRECIDSDEERERLHVKSFNEKAKRNRRLNRLASSTLEDPSSSSIFRDDDESKELFKCLMRTNSPTQLAKASKDNFGICSGFSLTSSSTSCFVRAAGGMKNFSSSINSAKAYVFSTIMEDEDDKEKENQSAENSFSTAKLVRQSSTGIMKRKAKQTNDNHLKKNRSSKKKGPSLFDALEQYQCKK